MKRDEENIFDMLAQFPWWVSVIFSIVVYNILASAFPGIAWIAIVFLFPAVVSAVNTFRKRQLFNHQTGIESIRQLTWREFEELLGEAFRRHGYGVKENVVSGPDGGVDIAISKHGKDYLVQCKQWKKFKVGVKVVREMYGVMHHKSADGVIIVTSGEFTNEAKSFASDKPIDLIDGNALVDMIQVAKSDDDLGTKAQVSKHIPEPDVRSVCPRCENKLVVRTARRGKNAGSQFLGCSSFPNCRFTRPLDG